MRSQHSGTPWYAGPWESILTSLYLTAYSESSALLGAEDNASDKSRRQRNIICQDVKTENKIKHLAAMGRKKDKLSQRGVRDKCLVKGPKDRPKDGRTNGREIVGSFRMRWVMEPVIGEEPCQNPALKIFCSCVLTSRCTKNLNPTPDTSTQAQCPKT